MLIGRFQHASCALDDSLFVFCGYSRHQRKFLSSIEHLNLKDTSTGFVQVGGESSISPRCNLSTISISESKQILIIGGTDQYYSLLTDVHVFDPAQQSI